MQIFGSKTSEKARQCRGLLDLLKTLQIQTMAVRSSENYLIMEVVVQSLQVC